MLSTKKQIKNTKELLENVIQSKESFERTLDPNSILTKIQMSSSNRLIEKLTAQIAEYENLQKEVVMIESKEITQLSDILISARIAKGWSQKELAEKLNLAEQQIQRYEITEYAGASFVKMVDVAMALELNLKFKGFTIFKKDFLEKFIGYEYLLESENIKKHGFELINS
ncbi:MAG: helix-turn-helix domain-containing protein [Cytophagales bacterium]|nr:MAG: helix-turn-helix domain-containing protein [Cytophagales bacterium]